MVIRETFSAFCVRLLTLVLAIATLTLLLIDDQMEGAPLNGIRYYAEITTLIVAFVMLLKAIVNFRGLFGGGARHRLAPSCPAPLSFFALCVSMGLAIAHPLYVFYLNSPYFPSDGAVGAIFAYIILPLLVLIEWLLFEKKGIIKWPFAFYAAMPPLFYFVGSFLSHGVRGESSAFACGIFDHWSFMIGQNEGLFAFLSGNDGWNGVAFSSLSVLFCQLLVAFFLLFLGDSLAGKYRHAEHA